MNLDEPPTTAPDAERAGCVLLAEDDPQMRAMLVRRLRKRGYAVVEAHDGRQLSALLDTLVLDARTTARAIDVIITDVRMPGASGIDALAQLRARDWATPMILMTAFGEAELHAEAMRLGASAVFDKPFDVDELCSAVVELTAP